MFLVCCFPMRNIMIIRIQNGRWNSLMDYSLSFFLHFFLSSSVMSFIFVFRSNFISIYLIHKILMIYLPTFFFILFFVFVFFWLDQFPVTKYKIILMTMIKPIEMFHWMFLLLFTQNNSSAFIV